MVGVLRPRQRRYLTCPAFEVWTARGDRLVDHPDKGSKPDLGGPPPVWMTDVAKQRRYQKYQRDPVGQFGAPSGPRQGEGRPFPINRGAPGEMRVSSGEVVTPHFALEFPSVTVSYHRMRVVDFLRKGPRHWRRRFRLRAAQAAGRWYNSPKVAKRTAARRRRDLEACRTRVPRLSGIDAAIVDGLGRDGLFICSIGDLDIPELADSVSDAWDLAQTYARTDLADVPSKRDKPMVTPTMLMARPGIFRAGLHHRLLDVAEAYLGLPAAYDGAAILYSVADGQSFGARNWHRDREDERMLKIAIYCNDVDAEGGPFEMQLGEPDQSKVVSCAGPKGTVIFADTARNFHRGRPPTGRDRVAIFFSYVRSPVARPFFCQRSGLSTAQIAALTVDVDERQRRSAQWLRHTPLPLRWIPAAPV